METEAKAHYQRALECFREMLNCLYGDPYFNENLAVARINLARLQKADDPAGAFEHLEAARAELVGLIQRDGPRQQRVELLRRCLRELLSLQRQRGVNTQSTEALLEALDATDGADGN